MVMPLKQQLKNSNGDKQKQSFADVLENRCSSKFRKFHRKTPMLECLFNKAAALKA